MNAQMESYALEQASLRAGFLGLMAGFPRHEIDDVRQDLLLDCLRRSSRFDPARGDWPGFVRGVTRNQASVLAVRRRRRLRQEVLAGDLLEPNADGPEEFFDRVMAPETVDGLNTAVDVRRVLDRLPAHLHELALFLPHMTVIEVCAATGKSRSRVYQLVRQIRDAFVRAGFRPCCPRKAVVSHGGKTCTEVKRRANEPV